MLLPPQQLDARVDGQPKPQKMLEKVVRTQKPAVLVRNPPHDKLPLVRHRRVPQPLKLLVHSPVPHRAGPLVAHVVDEPQIWSPRA